MFLSQIEYSKCQSCKGDIYPIFHGNYFSYLNSSISYDDYTYCHLDDIKLVNMNLYSNLDILFTYESKIINNPITEVVVPQKYFSVVRIDSTLGKTIWAKEIVYYPGNNFFVISGTILVDDIAWSLFVYRLSDLNTPGVIAKLNGDGNLIDIFYAPFSINIGPFGSYIFQAYNFFVFSDSSFIITARCSYNQGEFGVSEYSMTDFCFFKIDSNKNFQWSSSIDLINLIEEQQSFYEYNNTLYVAFVSSKFYYCLSILNKDSGEFQNISIFNSTNPQCYYLNKSQDETYYKSLYITFISDNAVYAYGYSPYGPPIFNWCLYLFNPKTLKIIKVLSMQTGCKIYQGYRSIELNRDIMFCTNSVAMNKIYF